MTSSKSQEWKPSKWGQIFTGSPEWRLQLKGEDFVLVLNGEDHRTPIRDDAVMRVQPGLFWADVALSPGSDHELKVDGLPNAQAVALQAALDSVLSEQRLRRDTDFVLKGYATIQDWLRQITGILQQAEIDRRWIPYETQSSLLAAWPALDGETLEARFQQAAVKDRLGKKVQNIETAIRLWKCRWQPDWVQINEKHTLRELSACKVLLDSVESRPLTEEQARAVICFDNRVQVVASAGSGKTSIMVAKAAYAIHRGFMAPQNIVLMAFNKKAAEELKDRAIRAFERLGMDGNGVEATTFHALGLGIIGKTTGKKPDVPAWATDTGASCEKILEIVDCLKDQSDEFRTRWDMFRMIFGRDLSPPGQPVEGDAWDRMGTALIKTLDGQRVRSQEEAIICNWLFYNGVHYEYERPYETDTADVTHRQYKPDFYYPDILLYHEHFALDAEGKAPPQFKDYVEGVKWKRQLHHDMGTALIETTSHQVRNGGVFEHLAHELTSRGVKLDPNPNRPIPQGAIRPMEAMELAYLVRSFISHAKSNCLNSTDLRRRLDAMPEGSFKYRHRMFLDLFEPIIANWDRALAEDGGIDFEDMLNMAAEHVEQGRCQVPYDLVMADEFQDASRARARLCRAMVQKPGRHFFAVGDDWQSINRFAGADVSVMTDFERWFDHGQLLKLEQTFRCPQALCDVSSHFVTKNPTQIRKRVHSDTPAVGPVLQAFEVSKERELERAVGEFLASLYQGICAGHIPLGRHGNVSVFFLGRYRADKPEHLRRWKSQYGSKIELSFVTIHSSKGSEADYVILPSMISRLRGLSFPSTRTDDPVLQMAMPSGDNFPQGEERRLFYVALTRARRSVIMFTVKGERSTFLDELVADKAVTVTNLHGEKIEEQRCPACKRGVIVTRTGPFGEFQSCSNYPACEYKPSSKDYPKNRKKLSEILSHL
ncbi:UvrD-helicase domain-containing protein [Acetobacter aceti]|uniref:DNA 3'-5' helicase n=1 Tax=Acetobacter aceti TaxID=435 RepID=A0A6S6PDB2_ACEAC|nr:UvrD-helicase domain-containing protein [Acetobacter aceti]BCI65678.1 hypothetical protein AAJCM20276_03020 [Acetobacter aceti]